MSRSQHWNNNNMKGQASIFSLKPTSLQDCLSMRIIQTDSRSQKFKKEKQTANKQKTTNLLKEFKAFREDTKKQLNEISSGRELKENKYKYKNGEHDKDKVPGLERELNKETEILKKIQAQVKMKLKIPIAHLETQRRVICIE